MNTFTSTGVPYTDIWYGNTTTQAYPSSTYYTRTYTGRTMHEANTGELRKMLERFIASNELAFDPPPKICHIEPEDEFQHNDGSEEKFFDNKDEFDKFVEDHTIKHEDSEENECR